MLLTVPPWCGLLEHIDRHRIVMFLLAAVAFAMSRVPLRGARVVASPDSRGSRALRAPVCENRPFIGTGVGFVCPRTVCEGCFRIQGHIVCGTCLCGHSENGGIATFLDEGPVPLHAESGGLRVRWHTAAPL